MGSCGVSRGVLTTCLGFSQGISGDSRSLFRLTLQFPGVRQRIGGPPNMFREGFHSVFRRFPQHVSNDSRKMLFESPQRVPSAACNKFSGMLASSFLISVARFLEKIIRGI